MCCQLERETERYMRLKNQAKRTPTLAEQYSRFIPVQVRLIQSVTCSALVFKLGLTLN